MHTATFFLSTGRCGTQWLARHLAAACGPETQVEHEPLHADYQPRRLLDDGARLGEPVLRHLEAVEARLERGSYLETGHPCWSALPHLASRFPGRLRVVHLTRHPVPTALSWTTMMAYAPPPVPGLPGRTPLSPFDAGVAFPDYQARWVELSAFEKCLYYWAEVNAFALRQERALAVPWLRVSHEELFDGAGLERLHAFLGVSAQDPGVERHQHVDAHRYLVPSAPDLAAAARHPRVWEVAQVLGYGPDMEGLTWRGNRLKVP